MSTINATWNRIRASLASKSRRTSGTKEVSEGETISGCQLILLQATAAPRMMAIVLAHFRRRILTTVSTAIGDPHQRGLRTTDWARPGMLGLLATMTAKEGKCGCLGFGHKEKLLLNSRDGDWPRLDYDPGLGKFPPFDDGLGKVPLADDGGGPKAVEQGPGARSASGNLPSYLYIFFLQYSCFLLSGPEHCIVRTSTRGLDHHVRLYIRIKFE
jgi:hypothetical protein